MKRKTLNTTKVTLIISFILGIVTLGVGASTYNEKADSISVEKAVDEVRAKKDFVTLDKVSKDFIDAIVAIEDRRFYNHGALDIIAIIRATVNNIKAGRVVEGGSTITQQLAKNLCLTNEVSLDRKLTEMFIAYELEKKYSKEEILELYINTIYYGDSHYGIKQATEGYFNKSPKDLTYDEATMLAGLPQAPSVYALSKKNGAAERRQKQVVAALERYNNQKDSINVFDYL